MTTILTAITVLIGLVPGNSGQAPTYEDRLPVSEDDKAMLIRDLNRILSISVRPNWKDRVLISVNSAIAGSQTRWTKNSLGFLYVSGPGVVAKLFKGAIFEYRVSPEWLDPDVEPSDREKPAGEPLSFGQSRSLLRDVLLSRAPAGWDFQPTVGGTVINYNFAKSLIPFFAAPTFNGYPLVVGQKSHYVVDRHSGAVTEFSSSNAWFPSVRPEDVTKVDKRSESRLAQEALRVYRSAEPLQSGYILGTSLTVQVPNLGYSLNEMTPRHRAREAKREAILVFTMAITSVTSRRAREVQNVFVDATTGKGISVLRYPMEMPIGKEGTLASAEEVLRAKWTLMGDQEHPIKLRRSSVDSIVSDKLIMIRSTAGLLLQVSVDLNKRVLWQSPTSQWSVSASDWKAVLAEKQPTRFGSSQTANSK